MLNLHLLVGTGEDGGGGSGGSHRPVARVMRERGKEEANPTADIRRTNLKHRKMYKSNSSKRCINFLGEADPSR